MNKKNIMEHVYTCSTYNDIIYNYINKTSALQEEFDDYKNELVIELNKIDENLLLKLYKKDELKFYFIKIVKNQFLNGNIKRKYIDNQNEELKEIISLDDDDREYEEENKKKTRKIRKYLDDQSSRKKFYQKKLFEEYIKEGSIRNLSRKTGIPKSEIHNVIVQVRNEIKEELK